MVLLVNLVLKEHLVEVEPDRDRAHDESVQVVARLEELQHRLAEAGSGALLRPAVLPGRVPVTPNLHGFLEVGRLGAQRGDLVRVGGLGDALATNLHVTTVCTGVLPCQLGLYSSSLINILPAVVVQLWTYLGLHRQTEELGALRQWIPFSVQAETS